MRTGRNITVTAIAALSFAIVMLGLSYAAVPLYDMFCRATGFGGRTQVAQKAPETVTDRRLRIRFDANVAPGLGWSFSPEQTEIEVRVGDVVTAFYKITNTGSTTSSATATYNVTPPQTGYYFNKLECFCFTEQSLDPGQTLELPVVFFIDPAFASDRELTGVQTLTLSYSFFPSTSRTRPLAQR